MVFHNFHTIIIMMIFKFYNIISTIMMPLSGAEIFINNFQNRKKGGTLLYPMNEKLFPYYITKLPYSLNKGTHKK